MNPHNVCYHPDLLPPECCNALTCEVVLLSINVHFVLLLRVGQVPHPEDAHIHTKRCVLLKLVDQLLFLGIWSQLTCSVCSLMSPEKQGRTIRTITLLPHGLSVFNLVTGCYVTDTLWIEIMAFELLNLN